MKLTGLLLLCCALSGNAFAGVIVCSTGYSTATSAGCGSAINSPASNNLLPDGNWYLATNTSGTFQSQSYVTINNSAPLQNAGPWLANSASSAWITPANNQLANYINGNVAYYATQFSVAPGTDLSTLALSGSWLASDYGAGIFLNGVSVGQTALPTFGHEGGPATLFSIVQGLNLASFQTGTNTLVFGTVVDSTNHGSINNPSGSPSGVRVSFDAVSTVPLPASAWLLLSGLAGILLLRQRALPRHKSQAQQA